MFDRDNKGQMTQYIGENGSGNQAANDIYYITNYYGHSNEEFMEIFNRIYEVIKQDTVNDNLSYEDIVRIFNNLFEQNFYRISNEAKEIADSRCKELIIKFFTILYFQNPNGFNQAIDPDFQYDLFIAQRDYARCGDPVLSDMLVHLLIERTKETRRSRLQIILNESIATASKLTREEYDILTLWFVSQYCTESQEFHTLSDLRNFIETYIMPFLDSFNNEKSWHTHLVYAGCGFIQAFKVMDIYNIIHNKSASITPKGFRNIFGYLIEEYPNIESFFRIGELYFNEANFYDPKLDKQESYMSLTSVGIAIGYANLCRITGEEFNLSKWL